MGHLGHNAAHYSRRQNIDPKLSFDLRGQTALVGGASQGIGQAVARVLAEAGALVVLMSRRLDALEITRAMLPDPKSHKTFAVDLERLEDISTGLARIVAETGPITIWVNNTGGPKAGPLSDASADEMERAYAWFLGYNDLGLPLADPVR